MVVPVVDPVDHTLRRGTLSIAWAEAGRADDVAVAIVTDVATRCALALARAEHRLGSATSIANRDGVLRTQQALLPNVLVHHDRLHMASRYVPSSDEIAAGGDWYHALPLTDGRVALAVGDVTGHGFAAALAMGQHRHDFETLVAHHPDATQLLHDLDELAAERDSAMTMAIGVVDADGRNLDTVLAGHPPPLLIRDRDASLVEATTGPPLGYQLDGRRWGPTRRTRLQQGDLVLLYTDGLVERRSESIDAGIQRLGHVASAAGPDDLEEMCDHIIEELGHESSTDDIALLAVRVC